MDVERRDSAETVAVLLEQVGRAVQSLCFAKGLHPAQWSALRYLESAPTAARTVSGLASYQGTTLAPASRTITSLTRKGLVVQKANSGDRRSRILALSPAGQAVMADDPLRVLRNAVSDLPDPHQGAMRGDLVQILETLVAESRATGGLAPGESEGMMVAAE